MTLYEILVVRLGEQPTPEEFAHAINRKHVVKEQLYANIVELYGKWIESYLPNNGLQLKALYQFTAFEIAQYKKDEAPEPSDLFESVMNRMAFAETWAASLKHAFPEQSTRDVFKKNQDIQVKNVRFLNNRKSKIKIKKNRQTPSTRAIVQSLAEEMYPLGYTYSEIADYAHLEYGLNRNSCYQYASSYIANTIKPRQASKRE